LALEPPSQAALDFVARVGNAFAALTESTLAHPELGLGGKLLYAGELDDDGRALVVAANIAGAATLAVAPETAAQKQALRDGVVDFVVTTLDESLRILKNELRKRQTVAVCVAIDPVLIEREMNERGVLADLLRRDAPFASLHPALLLQEGDESETDFRKIPALVTWRAPSAPPQEMAKLDEIALACLDPDEWQSSRWLRLAPRYLGRMAHGMRLHYTHREFAARFAEQARERVNRGEIAFPFEIQSTFRGGHDQFCFNQDKQRGVSSNP
jgi:urocanate hydratase